MRRRACRRSITPRTFQSTHPLRGATIATTRYPTGSPNFNPRTPCGVRQAGYTGQAHPTEHFNPRTPCGVRPLILSRRPMTILISIHAPLAGCDHELSKLKADWKISIHAPLAGCDARDVYGIDNGLISIHAPLAGCDVQAITNFRVIVHFNPRTPCGVRLDTSIVIGTIKKFQSTHPLRGATPRIIKIESRLKNFNPRTPCGVRQRKCTKFSAHFAITDNSIGFPRPECRLLGHFLLISGACGARERVRTFL